MNITVLGYQSPYPGFQQATLGYLLESQNGTKVLLECGSGVVSAMQEWIEPYQLDAVLLSHYHFDHVADLGILQYAILMENKLQNKSKVLPIYGPSEPNDRSAHRMYKDVTIAIDIAEDVTHTIGEFRISYFQTDHDGPCYGMVIEEGYKMLLYGADSGPQTKWPSLAAQPDLMVLESTFLEKNRNPQVKHLTAADAAKIANQFTSKRLLLTHFYPKMNPQFYLQEAQLHYSNEILLPSKGLKIIL
ncbi:MBL fold metallo-hydrolase [Caldalkalibacillus mannanilyticus]|uniref:MBL fold metallo-hydrolase n=1 Tax=Caldalkalibacillus mannanilyticus TaxID=1418 RepID=UPI0004692744|nr:MBL fold metallo-hydrolase [Caldalkalibacillus mannanilyticus]